MLYWLQFRDMGPQLIIKHCDNNSHQSDTHLTRTKKVSYKSLYLYEVNRIPMDFIGFSNRLFWRQRNRMNNYQRQFCSSNEIPVSPAHGNSYQCYQRITVFNYSYSFPRELRQLKYQQPSERVLSFFHRQHSQAQNGMVAHVTEEANSELKTSISDPFTLINCSTYKGSCSETLKVAACILNAGERMNGAHVSIEKDLNDTPVRQLSVYILTCRFQFPGWVLLSPAAVLDSPSGSLWLTWSGTASLLLEHRLSSKQKYWFLVLN